MRVRHLTAALAVAGLLAFAGPAMAEDTIKLKLPPRPSGDLFDLKASEADLLTETIDTRRYYGGFGRGFYGGGFYGGYGRGFYGGYGRGFYGGGFYGRGFYGRGFYGGYRGFYGGYRAFYPRFGYSYFPSYYAYSGFSPGYYSYAYTYPCSVVTAAPAVTVRVGPAYSLRPALPGGVNPTLPPPREDTTPPGTFPYDGGPKQGVPMPPPGEKGDGAASQPGKPGIVEDILVSAAPMEVSGKGKWAYPAYGEAPRRASKGSTGFQLMVYGRKAD